MKVIDDALHKIEYTIKNSRFICLIKYVTTEKDARQFINQYLDPKATHNCYCYITNNNEIQKYDDDKEPIRTAGFAMLTYLQKQNITNIVVLNIRYFGKILLGKSRLIHAYKFGLQKLFLNLKLYPLEIIYEYTISFPYEHQKLINKIIKEHQGNIIKQLYSEVIMITFTSNKNTWQHLLPNNTKFAKQTIIQKRKLKND
ncbi:MULTISPECIES: YigZ family protein [unclassified Spiroplasma]|uniref:IMPACT family protein n=1 Tax=unclassified Spiroplasma TaxID=2637901 RepID=UPI0030CB4CC6